MSGKYQFEGPARLSSLIVRPATKNPAAPVRLRSNRGSSRSAMFAFATAIAEFISFFVARAGITNRTRRVYRELGLQLRNKTPKRRVKAKLRDDRRPATRSNETWAMDFVHDQLATGRKLRVLTVIDTFSRFSPALAPRFTFRGTYVMEILEGVCNAVGFPATIRVDHTPSSCREILPSGPIDAASRWTSPGPANPQTMPSSKRSTGTLPGGMPQCPLVREPCRRAGKSGEAIGNKPILLHNHDDATSPPS